MTDLYQDKIFELDFRNTTYILHLTISPTNLLIDLEKKATGDIWIGQFTSQKLEQNSQKTGNRKKYPIFIQMLLAAIHSSNDSVELDLLTHHDLQQIKAKKAAQSGNYKTIYQQSTSPNKLILLLNYVAQFEKVHYPLNLFLQEIPSVQRQKQTIKRLRSQINIYRRDTQLPQQLISQNINLKQQNQMYKLRIKKIQQSQSKMMFPTQTPVQQKIVIKQVKDSSLEREYNELKLKFQTLQNQFNLSKSKLAHKQQQNRQLKQQIQRLNNQLINDSQSKDVRHQKNIRKIQQKLCKQFNQQLKSVNKQTQQLVTQLKKSKEENKRYKTKINELQKQLSLIVKRNLSKQKIGITTSTLINTKRSETPRSTNKSKQKTLSKSKISNNFSTSYHLKNSKSKDKKRDSLSKRKSVMDSDTQSSRMRRMSNQYVSPYRTNQGIKRSPSNKSFKEMSPKSNRSQNKSQSRIQSQQSLNNSQVFTQSQNNFHNAFASDSDDQSNIKLSENVEKLRRMREQRSKKGIETRNKMMNKSKNTENNKLSKGDKKIMNIAEMLKQSRKQLIDE